MEECKVLKEEKAGWVCEGLEEVGHVLEGLAWREQLAVLRLGHRVEEEGILSVVAGVRWVWREEDGVEEACVSCLHQPVNCSQLRLEGGCRY